MPLVPFESLPANARVWIFSADRPITGRHSSDLLSEVDSFLTEWKAHGHPLTCGRAWRDDRFLAIAVDQTDSYASGCSIDGLFRRLQAMQSTLGASIVGGGQIHYRDPSGAIKTVSRDEFTTLGARGGVTTATPVFDTTVATAGDWRDRFETSAGRTWHKALL